MEKKTDTKKTNTADGYANVVIHVQDKLGNWHTLRAGIPLSNAKPPEKGILANPDVLTDPERVKFECTVNVAKVYDAPVEF